MRCKVKSLLMGILLALTITTPIYAKEFSAATNLTTEPLVFNVSVPTTLPINVDENNVAVVANDVKIVNNSIAPVAITNIETNVKNGWKIVENTPVKKVGAKEIQFEIHPDSSIILGKSNTPITYSGNVSPQNTNVVAQPVVEVVFVIDWDVAKYNVSATSSLIKTINGFYLNDMNTIEVPKDKNVTVKIGETPANTHVSGITVDGVNANAVGSQNNTSWQFLMPNKNCSLGTITESCTGSSGDISYKFIDTNKHAIVSSGSCTKCGNTFSSSKEEKHTAGSMIPTKYNSLGESGHTVFYDIPCRDCKGIISGGSSFNIHNFSGNTCIDCGYKKA